MGEMTSWERVMSALELQKADRIPVIPQLTYAAAKFMDMEIDEALDDFEKQKAALLNSKKLGGYDGVYAGWEGSFTLVTNSLGAPMKKYSDKPPSIEKPLIASKKDLEELPEFVPASLERIQTNMQLIKTLKLEAKDTPILSYIPAPFTLASLILGLSEFMLTVMRDKMNILEDLLQYTYQTTRAFAIAKAEAGVDMITIADPTGSSDLMSPKLFEKHSFPLLKKLIAELQEKKKRIGLHICGNTKPILLKMAETGADYLEIDSKVDLAWAQEAIDGKICLVGNISPTDLSIKPPQEIKQQCETLLKKMKPGFILSSGCEVAYSTPIENIQVMVETTKALK
ncbi:MAG: uroporphyrinogen decarboxylase family protein [Candidatus Helarchaeota archaeon]|nr:uroporphyrinogen decarboxylase family protein [Candidatus Helarchaeota archaeon]